MIGKPDRTTESAMAGWNNARKLVDRSVAAQAKLLNTYTRNETIEVVTGRIRQGGGVARVGRREPGVDRVTIARTKHLFNFKR